MFDNHSLYNTSIKYLALTFCCCFLFSCTSGQIPKTAIKKESVHSNAQWISATVIFLEFEGGFYGLITNEGEQLVPMNLASEYKAVNTKLKIKGKKMENMMTIQQWGAPFEITKTKLISKGKVIKKTSHE